MNAGCVANNLQEQTNNERTNIENHSNTHRQRHSERQHSLDVVASSAPADYDGFGTFEVNSYQDKSMKLPQRTVLIRDEYYDWQTNRYHSGMHQFRESLHDEADIAEELWKRLRGKELK